MSLLELSKAGKGRTNLWLPVHGLVIVTGKQFVTCPKGDQYHHVTQIPTILIHCQHQNLHTRRVRSNYNSKWFEWSNEQYVLEAWKWCKSLYYNLVIDSYRRVMISKHKGATILDAITCVESAWMQQTWWLWQRAIEDTGPWWPR